MIISMNNMTPGLRMSQRGQSMISVSLWSRGFGMVFKERNFY